jgi:hypothetical protein
MKDDDYVGRRIDPLEEQLHSCAPGPADGMAAVLAAGEG